jgi:hypothetical protein
LCQTPLRVNGGAGTHRRPPQRSSPEARHKSGHHNCMTQAASPMRLATPITSATRRSLPISAPYGSYRLSGTGFVVAWPLEGPLDVPDPVPMVSPVVPLFIAPLLTPAPRLGRSLERLAPVEPAGLTVAGDTAASPVVEPVPAFCASASELVKRTADTAAIDANFISNFLRRCRTELPIRATAIKSEQASGGKVPAGRSRLRIMLRASVRSRQLTCSTASASSRKP